MKKLLPLLFAILAIPALSYATDRWASPSGGGSTCSSGTPCSVTTAVSQLVAGDSLKLKNGTYTTIALTDPLPSGISAVQPTCMIGESRSGVQIVPSNAVSGITIALTVARSNICFKDMTFDGVNQSTSGSKTAIRTSNGIAITGMVLDNIHVRRYGYNLTTCDSLTSGNGVVIADNISGTIIRNSTFDQNGCVNEVGDGPSGHGIYYRGQNGIVEHNNFTNNDNYGIQFYSGALGVINNLFRYNYVAGNANGIYFASGSAAGNIANNNIIANNTFQGIYVAYANQLYNNTVYGNGTGVLNSTNCILRNNLIIGNTTNRSGTCATTGTESNNRTTGTATDFMIDPANGNFNLKESVAAIDGGAVITGFSEGRYVGAGVDQGAFEAPLRSSAVVEDGDASTYRVTFALPTQSTRNGTGLQTCTVANSAMVVAGSGATESSCTVTGTSRVDTTLGSAVTNGQSLTDAYTRSTAPTLTDNMCIGDPTTACYNAQVRTYSAASGTNNVGAAPSLALEQSHYEFHKLRGTEDAPALICAICTEDVPVSTPPGAAFRLRVKFRTNDDPEGTTYKLRYSKDGGAYTDIPDAFAADGIAWYGSTADSDIPAAGTATTEQLTSDEASNTVCAVIRTSSDYPLLDLNNSETECEYAVKISTSVAATSTFDFRVYKGDNTALDTYTVTPRLIVGNYVMAW